MDFIHFHNARNLSKSLVKLFLCLPFFGGIVLVLGLGSCQKRYVCAAYSSYFMPVETDLETYFYPFDTSAKPKSGQEKVMVKDKTTGLYKRMPKKKEVKKLDVFLAKEKEFYKPVDSLSVKSSPNKKREVRTAIKKENSDTSDDSPTDEEPSEDPNKQ